MRDLYHAMQFREKLALRGVRIYRRGHQQPPWSRWQLRLRWEIGHLRRHIAEAKARAR